MAAPFTTVWRHYSGTLGTDGLAFVASGNSTGTHAIAGGAFASASSGSDTDVVWTGSRGACIPVVASYTEYDPGSDTTYLNFSVAGTPGAPFRIHIWVHI